MAEKDDNNSRNKSRGATGAGGEAAEGIHAAGGDRDPGADSSVEELPTGSGDARSGSEPLVDRETEHRSGYGGAGGKPVQSSDKRKR